MLDTTWKFLYKMLNKHFLNIKIEIIKNKIYNVVDQCPLSWQWVDRNAKVFFVHKYYS